MVFCREWKDPIFVFLFLEQKNENPWRQCGISYFPVNFNKAKSTLPSGVSRNRKSETKSVHWRRLTVPNRSPLTLIGLLGFRHGVRLFWWNTLRLLCGRSLIKSLQGNKKCSSNNSFFVVFWWKSTCNVEKVGRYIAHLYFNYSKSQTHIFC